MLFCLISITLSMVLGALLMPRVLVISYKKKLFDIPDGRKVHTAPIPRLGGVTFFPITIISFLSALAICYKLFGYFPGDEYMGLTFLFYAFFIGLTSLYLIGCADDLIGVGYKSKFLVQLVVASLFPFSGLYINNLGGLFGIYELPFWLGSILTVYHQCHQSDRRHRRPRIRSFVDSIGLPCFAFLCLWRHPASHIHRRCGGCPLRILLL